ncbi:hypothetical protein HPB49_023452 [Dermacentor silvarum]|uniref:Uncharacterized protein n=1 Tax=Dermacentor silvarum TaxID=543639 RepID=A0ACB8CI13_DERSI|nr:uncharacterized protein LOC119458196 [Dermacentor silvarum]KAH7942362.1 hypothetical protein HPB49_023452 [Dermacentor silvarum]
MLRTWSTTFLAVFFITYALCQELPFKPGCTKKQLNDCGSDFLIYSNVTQLPESGQEFLNNCKYLSNQLSCALEFSKDCLEGLPRVAALLSLTAMEEEYEAVCTEGTEQNELYRKGIGCMNKAGDQLHTCMATMRDDMETGLVAAPQKEVIHYSCCAFHKSQDCFDDALAQCPNTAAKEFMNNVMEEVFGEVLGLVCGQYSRGSTACKELPVLAPPDSENFGNKDLFELAIQNAAILATGGSS